jgi:ubiquinone/menaquinone biosynthesis C-methylase UbiE
MNFFIWLGLIVLAIVAGVILDREIWFYEGVHLGPRVQAWLYDRWAKKYDVDKAASQSRDNEMLAQPLLDALKDVPEPFVLDFATGTGRLSFALMSRPEFKGRILALDLSRGMLEQAASKLTGHLSRVDLLRHPSLPLPFPDAAFDVVCALEVLELFPSMDIPLTELARVLRPGGTLVITRGTEASGRKAKIKSRSEMVELLTTHGFENLEISPWWKLFERVIAVKDGASHTVGKHGLLDVYQCSACNHIQWEKADAALKCGHCGKVLPVTAEGILLG